MSQQAQPIHSSSQAATSVIPGSLRADMEARRAAGDGFSVQEALGIIVPLCTQLAELHAQGRTLYAHPSAIQYTCGGTPQVILERAQAASAHPRDRACLA